MQVTEIFRSIQGESTYAGLPCIFVRLTGCNLRCTWCDTAYAFYGGRTMSVDEALEVVRGFSEESGRRRVNLVEITGGEPLLQKEVIPLTERLLEHGYQVLVETSGERFIGNLPPAVIRIVDVKCPGSGEGGTFCMENLKALNSRDQLKFVLADRQDYEWARDFLRQHRLEETVEAVIFSPVFGQLEPRPLAEWILADGLPVRLGLQLHKFIWHPDMQGV
jgi:7-carboxy-7-deazaguanine synthase